MITRERAHTAIRGCAARVCAGAYRAEHDARVRSVRHARFGIAAQRRVTGKTNILEVRGRCAFYIAADVAPGIQVSEERRKVDRALRVLGDRGPEVSSACGLVLCNIGKWRDICPGFNTYEDEGDDCDGGGQHSSVDDDDRQTADSSRGPTDDRF